MNIRTIARMALFSATAFVLLCSIGMHATWAASTPPSQACVDAVKQAAVEGADKVDASNPNDRSVALGDRISVTVSGLANDFQKACTATPIVLYLNSYPMRSLTGTTAPVPNAPSANKLTFALRVTDGSRASWVPILGSPSTHPREISVSVGLEDLYPLPPGAGKTLPQFNLNIIGNLWFYGWVVLFLILLAGFIVCAACTNVIRDGNPAGGGWGMFSLSKSQGAWWFFIILAAYLLIGLVTGDFFNSINSTALILLGIGAGTVVGSAIIDNTMNTPVAKGNNDYFKEILSDANGVNFHRFQLMAWTIVLGIIFAKGVYQDLAMPEFNTTLMGLLGLSAGTYLGLKIPEK